MIYHCRPAQRILRACLLLGGSLLLGILVSCAGSGGGGATLTAESGPAPTQGEPGGEPELPVQELVLAENGKLNCRIVYPAEGGTLFADYAQSVADTIKKQVGEEPPVIRESNLKQADTPTIYVGPTEAFRQTEANRGSAWGDWQIVADGHDIYVIAYSPAGLSRATTILNGRLRNCTENGSIRLHDYENAGSVSFGWADELPFYQTEKTAWCYGVGGGTSYEVVVAGADESDFSAYLGQLPDLQYTEHSRRETVAGSFATLFNDAQALYVSLSGGELRVVSVPIDEAFLPDDSPADFEKVCDTTGYLLGVSGNGTYENGMGMFYLLSDGSFLVYDMGNTEQDADQLYGRLSSVAQEHQLSSIRISAWIVTHCHGDHVGGFPSFMKKYADRVTLELLMLNLSDADQGSAYSPSLEQAVQSAVQQYSPQTRTVRLQTGQLFWLADVQVEVLYTLADLRQGTFSNYNDSSMVTRLTINGKTVLMTGDAAPPTWQVLIERYGDALKSDYLQVPHHGVQPGGTIAAYDLIDPDYLLWPAGKSLYDTNLVQTEQSKHLIQMVKPENIYLAGSIGTITEIDFTL